METKKFKAFDKVIARFRDKTWMCDLYSHYNTKINRHVTLGFPDLEDDCILPYEGNEHLVGTDLPAEEEVKLEDEYMFGITYDDDLEPDLDGVIMLGKIKSLTKTNKTEYFNFENFTKMYAIRFSDFNPNDMEETSRHILCVKNGKIVKYKG